MTPLIFRLVLEFSIGVPAPPGPHFPRVPEVKRRKLTRALYAELTVELAGLPTAPSTDHIHWARLPANRNVKSISALMTKKTILETLWRRLKPEKNTEQSITARGLIQTACKVIQDSYETYCALSTGTEVHVARRWGMSLMLMIFLSSWHFFGTLRGRCLSYTPHGCRKGMETIGNTANRFMDHQLQIDAAIVNLTTNPSLYGSLAYGIEELGIEDENECPIPAIRFEQHDATLDPDRLQNWIINLTDLLKDIGLPEQAKYYEKTVRANQDDATVSELIAKIKATTIKNKKTVESVNYD
ncbi:hypothetical protein ACEPPN_003008 [Leptodophora sp. 'Broadleaf-Isolate-01']